MSLSSSRLRSVWLLAATLSIFALGACTHAPVAKNSEQTQQDADDADPFEPFNRVLYHINHALDVVILRPVTQVYRFAVPEQGRQMVSNVVNNIYAPVVFGNSVLQGDPQNSFSTLWRFMINSTFGIGGLFDPASNIGLKNHPADLGETFAMYGVGSGPYLVLPVIGPSNCRDALGRLGDAFMNPFNYGGNVSSAVLWSTTAVDARSNNMKILDDIYNTSLDPYTTFRSGFTQKRASDIRRVTASRNESQEKAGFR